MIVSAWTGRAIKIAPELVKELQRLSREERLEVIRLLQDDLVEKSCESEMLLSEPGRVYRLPSVRVNFNKARIVLDLVEQKSEAND